MTVPVSPAAPKRRRFPLFASLGVLLLLSSVVTALVALRSHAGTPGDASAANSATTPGQGIVAVGHVDIEQGITPLSPVQSGRVVRIEAKEGQAVKEDAPLLYLDDTAATLTEKDARIAVEAAWVRLEEASNLATQQGKRIAVQQQAIEAATRDVELARVQRDKAQTRYEHKTGGSREDVDSAELLIKKAEAALNGEKAKLALLKAQQPAHAVALAEQDLNAKMVDLDKARQAVKECVLRAPMAGTPLRILATVGEPLGPNPRQPAMFFCPASEISPRIIRAEVEQEFASRVREGQTARIQDDATGGGSWTGKVKHVSDWYTQRRSILLEPLQFNDVRTLECIITLDPNQPPPAIGQRVRVFLE